MWNSTVSSLVQTRMHVFRVWSHRFLCAPCNKLLWSPVAMETSKLLKISFAYTHSNVKMVGILMPFMWDPAVSSFVQSLAMYQFKLPVPLWPLWQFVVISCHYVWWWSKAVKSKACQCEHDLNNLCTRNLMQHVWTWSDIYTACIFLLWTYVYRYIGNCCLVLQISNCKTMGEKIR